MRALRNTKLIGLVFIALIVTAALLNFFIGFAIWGTNVTVRIGG